MTIDSETDDRLWRFLIERSDVRGEIIRLSNVWRQLTDGRGYPAPVRDTFGHALAAVGLLGSTIKFNGSLIMQINGAGPMRLLVAQATADRNLRGLATWRGQVEAAPLSELFDKGRMVMTIDPGGEQYQSIVPLAADDIATLLRDYFQQSEQLPTEFWFASNADVCCGLMLQRLPGGGLDEDAWSRCLLKAQTVTAAELLDLHPAVLLRRLFGEEDCRLFKPDPYRFECQCSRERIEKTLEMMGEAELNDIIAEEGEIEVHCEFCNERYTFDGIDVQALFIAERSTFSSTTKH